MSKKKVKNHHFSKKGHAVTNSLKPLYFLYENQRLQN